MWGSGDFRKRCSVDVPLKEMEALSVHEKMLMKDLGFSSF